MKRLLVLLVVLIAIFSVISYGQYSLHNTAKQSVGPTPQVSLRSKDADDAKMTALKFYQTYDSCLKQPPAEAEGQVSQYCQEHNPYASSFLLQTLAEKEIVGADPIICGQNPPSGYSVSQVTKKDNTMTVALSESFGTTLQHLTVQLMKDDATWKVVDITCPQP